ncbi:MULTISPECIES: hypothetical protein [Rhizobium]|uniref:Uncharacterized protein n=1 Tax=Rhizobium favelukesii TaxID=348824 RepID=W6RYH9_9HYPH|nr:MULTISPECIES: hypothetical protein [Rhizobium]MCS0458927.1 hypothetical protein [Rhizobium favelukesii]UFS83051.1 hypothetical protein LPB79_12410 [Rhizobium sp. T136]CDM59331.1 hypothetical protein LPU83_3688 [Rhizobium favelukesii]
MKALLRIFRPSRKLVFIIAGVALLGGVSGGAALFIGKDRILGLSAETMNGLSCTDVNLVTIKKQNRVWIRKYIKTEPTDGMTRVKTALRVAKAVYDAQKPDLVQVVVLDTNGPTLRSDIRGRAIGADVVYIPHPDAVLESAQAKAYTARYYDGSAAANGLFFGERVDLPEDEITALNASFNEYSDCIDPIAVAATKGGEGKSKGEKAEEAKEEKPAEGGGHGATPAEQPAAEEAAPAAGH